MFAAGVAVVFLPMGLGASVIVSAAVCPDAVSCAVTRCAPGVQVESSSETLNVPRLSACTEPGWHSSP